MNNDIFKGQELQFPVIYDFKVVLDTLRSDEENKKNIESVLSQTGLSYRSFSSKASSKGTYISYTVSIMVPSKEKFSELYQKVQLLPGIKTAL